MARSYAKARRMRHKSGSSDKPLTSCNQASFIGSACSAIGVNDGSGSDTPFTQSSSSAAKFTVTSPKLVLIDAGRINLDSMDRDFSGSFCVSDFSGNRNFTHCGCNLAHSSCTTYPPSMASPGSSPLEVLDLDSANTNLIGSGLYGESVTSSSSYRLPPCLGITRKHKKLSGTSSFCSSTDHTSFVEGDEDSFCVDCVEKQRDSQIVRKVQKASLTPLTKVSTILDGSTMDTGPQQLQQQQLYQQQQTCHNDSDTPEVKPILESPPRKLQRFVDPLAPDLVASSIPAPPNYDRYIALKSTMEIKVTEKSSVATTFRQNDGGHRMEEVIAGLTHLNVVPESKALGEDKTGKSMILII
ncbi:unnamed protein product [Protopolystoma xenopodis]|uniref:Uncharacterized protein n=1 Tax=Protopolystoma xenopodis TaxID=117903 RepID=A0A448WTG7_9PLAT|nr:unnamed protein product [Protopolystoma xenopodis]